MYNSVKQKKVLVLWNVERYISVEQRRVLMCGRNKRTTQNSREKYGSVEHGKVLVYLS